MPPAPKFAFHSARSPPLFGLGEPPRCQIRKSALFTLPSSLKSPPVGNRDVSCRVPASTTVFPLYVWLPRSTAVPVPVLVMPAPTPVSGVLMLNRPLPDTLSPLSAECVMGVLMSMSSLEPKFPTLHRRAR